MASRDEILRFIVETSGDESVIKLAKAIAEVGKASGEAAPEADKLLDELERITRLGNNIQQFIKLKAELADTEAKFNAAQKSAKELADELSRTAATSKEVNSAYAKSDKEVAALTDKFAAQSLESTRILLNSREGGLANSSGALGKYLMDHTWVAGGASGEIDHGLALALLDLRLAGAAVDHRAGSRRARRSWRSTRSRKIRSASGSRASRRARQPSR